MPLIRPDRGDQISYFQGAGPRLETVLNFSQSQRRFFNPLSSYYDGAVAAFNLLMEMLQGVTLLGFVSCHFFVSHEPHMSGSRDAHGTSSENTKVLHLMSVS